MTAAACGNGGPPNGNHRRLMASPDANDVSTISPEPRKRNPTTLPTPNAKALRQPRANDLPSLTNLIGINRNINQLPFADISVIVRDDFMLQLFSNVERIGGVGGGGFSRPSSGQLQRENKKKAEGNVDRPATKSHRNRNINAITTLLISTSNL